MKLTKDDKAQVEMVQMAIYIFIMTVLMYAVVMIVPSVFGVVGQLDAAADTTGSLYYDVPAVFDQATDIWYFICIMGIAILMIHFGLMAIKKQRYTGQADESEF